MVDSGGIMPPEASPTSTADVAAAPAPSCPPAGLPAACDATTGRNKVAAGLQALIALETMVLALVYWTSTQILAYHSDAVATRWEEMTPEWQRLIVAIYNVVGCTMMTQALYLVGFGIPAVARGDRFARWVLVAVQAVHWGPMLHTSLSVQRSTPAETPWKFAALYGIMSVFAFFIGHSPSRREPRDAVVTKGPAPAK